MADVESLPPSYNEVISQHLKFDAAAANKSARPIRHYRSSIYYSPRLSSNQHHLSRVIPCTHEISRAPNSSSSRNAFVVFRQSEQNHRTIEQRLMLNLPYNYVRFHAQYLMVATILTMFIYTVLMHENSLFSIGLPGNFNSNYILFK